MALALYRRYRSSTFDELVGQEHIATTLRNQVTLNKVAHAYLFTGIRGTGKTSAARILARAVNCENSTNGEPCNTCVSCLSILEGAAMDVQEIDAASNRGIEEMRNLREKVHFLPATLSKKVYIIDEAHMLTSEAWNAFLKTLEEPPSHILFILATTDPQRVPETVRSRVQRFDFRRLSVAELTTHLMSIAEKEHFSLSKDSASILAHASQGSARDALSFLDYVSSFVQQEGKLDVNMVRQALGIANPEVVNELLAALLAGDADRVLPVLKAIFDTGVEPRQLLHQMGEVAKGCAFRAYGSLHGDEIAVLPVVEPKYDVPSSWLTIIDAVVEKENSLRHAIDARMEVELTILKLLDYFQEKENRTGGMHDEKELLLSESTVPFIPELLKSPVNVEDAVPETVMLSKSVQISPDETLTDDSTQVGQQEKGIKSSEDLQLLWDRVLENAQKSDAMLAGVLRSCTLLGIDGSIATINAPFKFHFGQLNTPEKIQILEKVFAKADTAVLKVKLISGAEPVDTTSAGSPSSKEVTASVLDTFPGSTVVSSQLRDPTFENGTFENGRE